MTKIDFKNGQAPYLSDKILNQLQLNIENAIAEAKLESKKEENPIGHIRLELTDTNPATYLGFGTWELYAKGQVLVGVNPDDTDYNTAGKTGGKKTINLQHSHTVKAHNHTVSNHSHNLNGTGCALVGRSSVALGQIAYKVGTKPSNISNYKYDRRMSGANGMEGVSEAISDVSDLLGTTGSSGSGNTGNASPATDSQLNADIDIRQEYITCYMWKRVA